MDLPPNTVVDLTRTFGQVLIATFIATAFWGMTCMQTLMYFVTYETDRWSLKSLVIGLLVFDTVHEVICIQGLWTNLIPKFGDLVNISVVHTPFALEPLFTALVALMSQSFFAWRLWSFSDKNWIYPVSMFPLIIGQFVGFVVEVARDVGTSLTFADAQARNRNLLLGTSSVVAATDILIAVVMCILLWQGRTGFVDSERMILRVMNASVSTGVCMAVFALMSIILAAATPKDLFYVLGSIPLCPLYCNTVLANLNSRKAPRSVRGVDVSVPGKNSGRSVPISALAAPGLSSRTDTVSVNVHGEVDLEAKHAEYDGHEPAIAVQVETSKTTAYS